MNTIALNKKIIDFAPSLSRQPIPRIIQFGTGGLLRGLVDFIVDSANKKDIFNGSIVQIKSTKNGTTDTFNYQNNLYNVVIRGYKNNELIHSYHLNGSINQTIDANYQWDEVLQLAHSPNLNIIVSNTTETGISISPTDDISNKIPESYPAKLLALLHERFTYFQGGTDKGYIIIPTELVSNNGVYLKNLVITLATKWNYSNAFVDWIQNHNHFCNSLVDRIVTGKPSSQKMAIHLEHLQYEDDLLIECEPYLLWAIEGNHYVQQQLSFATPNSGVYVENSIEKYKELKLRLLNGTHSFACAKAINSGFTYVREAMSNTDFRTWIYDLIHKEIAPTLNYNSQEVTEFANNVLNRFSNPYIDHKWQDISLNYTQKMGFRNVENIIRYYKKYNAIPVKMAEGLAHYIQFMRATYVDDKGSYYGTVNGEYYKINDPRAEEFYTFFANYTPNAVIQKVLGNTAWWDYNLNDLPQFTETVQSFFVALKKSST